MYNFLKVIYNYFVGKEKGRFKNVRNDFFFKIENRKCIILFDDIVIYVIVLLKNIYFCICLFWGYI